MVPQSRASHRQKDYADPIVHQVGAAGLNLEVRVLPAEVVVVVLVAQPTG